MASRTGIDFNLERHQSTLLVDTRRFSEKLRSGLSGEVPVVLMAAVSALIFVVPSATEILALIGLLFFFYVRSVQKRAGLVLRMPKTSGAIDPKELSLKNQKPVLAEGIVYMGNDMDTGEEVWLTDVQARTHMLFMGTTGSGKTEALISLVFNALVHGSGFIYVDGKADSGLYGKIYSMARAMGREDDVLVINFQTGAKDIYGAQPTKLSNTLNPFANGSAGMLSELVKGLMASGEKSTWTQQAESFVEALMKPLVYLRDMHGLDLDVGVIRGFFGLNELEDLAWHSGDKYPGLIASGTLDGIHNYLLTKPGYKREKYHDQSEVTLEQHGYISMQLIRSFNSLSDTYGYIMKTPFAEVDFVDVFLNRRILVVLLPALEKSPSELTNLGRIVVASIKATMAKGLGSVLEGSWQKVIGSKPTTAPSPFMCVLDEYGYYAVEGFSVVPAQARSLGFAAIFAGQDLPAFEKASKEEAKSTIGNTNTRLCGKLECTETYEYFRKVAGTGTFTKLARFEREDSMMTSDGFKADDGISIENIDRVSFNALRGQQSGQWHLFFANTIIRLKSFFANPTPVTNLRVNHFIKVARPSAAEVATFHETFKLFTRAVSSDGGLHDFMDRVSSPADIIDIHAGFDLFKADESLLRAGKVLAYCAQSEDRRSRDFVDLTKRLKSPTEPPEEIAPLDFAAHMSGPAPTSDDDFSDPRFIDAAHHMETASKDSGYVSQSEPLYGSSQVDDDKDAKEEADVNDLFYDPENTATSESTGDGEQSQDVDEFDDEAPFESNDAKVRPATHGQIIPTASGTQFFGQTSAFGVEHYAIPEALYESDNDVSPDATDRPQDVGQVDGEHMDADADSEFDAPITQEGLLSREATVSGVGAIERATGAPNNESALTALAVAEAIATATTYPITAPSTKPDLEKFESVARKLSHILSEAADKEE